MKNFKINNSSVMDLKWLVKNGMKWIA